MSIDYNTPMVALFREVFEGQPEGTPTWILDREDGLFSLLDSLTHDQVSKRAGPALHTIGAHAFHVNYILQLTNQFIRGENPTPDWASSWTQQTFDESGWNNLRNSVHREYEGLLKWLSSDPDWPSDDWLKGALALIPHFAYHAGSIRQLKHIVLLD